MTTSLERLTWTRSQLDRALDALPRAAGLRRATASSPIFVRAPTAEEDLDHWLERSSKRLGLEVTMVDIAYDELDSLMGVIAPAVLPLHGSTHESFLILSRASGRDFEALSPDGSTHELARSVLRELLCRPLAPRAAALEKRLERAGVPPRSRRRVLGRTLASMLSSDARLGRCWLVRPASSDDFMRRLRSQGVLAQLGMLFTVRMLLTVLFIAAWTVIGSVTLGQSTGRGVVVAWGLLLGTVAIFQILETWLQSSVGIHANRLLRQRLLAGSFNLKIDDIRLEGAGSLFGRTIDADRLHGFAVTGGFEALSAVFQLLGATVVLRHDPLLLVLVAAWSMAVVLVSRRLHAENRGLTHARLSLTHNVVDGMVGYRTRLVQERPEAWHTTENARLGEYLRSSQRFDRAALSLYLLPGAWQVTTFIVLGLRFVHGGDVDTTLWIPLGGVLLAYGALRSFAEGIPPLSMAAMAWEQVAPLVASPPDPRETIDVPAQQRSAGPDSPPLLDLDGIHFGYASRHRAVLADCGLVVARGDRLLLEGPSGGGKSTLGALIAGLRAPSAGTILLDGLDQHALGFESWRRRIVSCPQFHENHVFADTFAFNLLMARSWPPSPADLEEAQHICEGLGLGPLLERMPLGIQQVIGESGWRISHGEQSRLFIARALLTGADILVLDESFAALDSETLQSSIDCVMRNCSTVITIAHP